MTMLIATATGACAVITQDSAVGLAVPKSQGFSVSNDADRELRRALSGDGKPRDDSAIAWRAGKVALFRDAQFATGNSGSLAVHQAHVRQLREARPASLDEAVRQAPELLRLALSAELVPTDHMQVYAGWSDEANAFAVWVFASAEDFSPTMQQAGAGHAMMPPPTPEDEAYPGLAARWTAAAQHDAPLERTLRFHRGYALNVRRSFLRGLYHADAVIGGPFLTACISRDGGWVERWSIPGETDITDEAA
jgi:hypothetical protein